MIVKRSPVEARQYLYSQVATLDPILQALCLSVVDNAAFNFAPAAAKYHHAFEGGLIVHTAEVVEKSLELALGSNVDVAVLIVAGIYHDYLKIMDYSPCGLSPDNPRGWAPVHGFEGNRHIIQGNALWQQRSEGLSKSFRLAVGHCLLSHHGKVEWGSAFPPSTAEAKILHAADMWSSSGGPACQRWNGY